MSDDLTALAADAYVYGFPLVSDLQQVSRFMREGMGAVPSAPFNHFSHAWRLAGPDERFVSVNNDTVYSFAQVDVSGGPVLLRVPEADGRYYVLQFVDALARAGDPPQMTYLNIADKLQNTVHANDFSFYEEINTLVQEEPANALDPERAGQCAAIGIVKGQPFAPDARMRRILSQAAPLGAAAARALTYKRHPDPLAAPNR